MRKNIMGSRAEAAANAPAAKGGGVVISPNLNEEHDFINHNGDKVKPFTKQIIEKNDPGYIPTAAEIASAQKKGRKGEEKEEKGGGSAIGDVVRNAIQAEINNAIVDALKEIDMGAMVKNAIKEALKPRE